MSTLCEDCLPNLLPILKYHKQSKSSIQISEPESLLNYFFIWNAVSCFTIARVSRELKWFREWQSNPSPCSWCGREIPFTRGYNLSPKQGHCKLKWRGEFCPSALDLCTVYLPQRAAWPSLPLLVSLLCKTEWFSSWELTAVQEQYFQRLSSFFSIQQMCSHHLCKAHYIYYVLFVQEECHLI